MRITIYAVDAKTVDEQIKTLITAGYDVSEENIEVIIGQAQAQAESCEAD